MGPGFVVMIAFIFGCIVGFVTGLIVSFVVVPLYYLINKISYEDRMIRGAKKLMLVLVSTGFFALAFATPPLVGFGIEIWNSNDYWASSGFGDWFRMPLEPPYELVTTSLSTDADIRVWEEKRMILAHITRYHKNGDLIVGEFAPVRVTRSNFYKGVVPDGVDIDAPPLPNPSWFVFDCVSGKLDTFALVEEYRTGLVAHGFSDEPILMSIQKNWNFYWAHPHREDAD